MIAVNDSEENRKQFFKPFISSEPPHARAMRLPDSWTMFTLTYGLMFNPSRAEASISTGVNSLKRSTGTFILILYFLK